MNHRTWLYFLGVFNIVLGVIGDAFFEFGISNVIVGCSILLAVFMTDIMWKIVYEVRQNRIVMMRIAKELFS